MNGYKCKDLSTGFFEITNTACPNRTVIISNDEAQAVLDFFREREWEAGIRDAIDDHPEGDLIKNVDEFVESCLDEVRSSYEIYGEFNGNYKDIVTDMIEEEE